MRFFLLLIALTACFSAQAQEVTYTAGKGAISITKKTGNHCKYLTVITNNSNCPHIVSYIPDFRCGSKKAKIPALNFNSELTNMKEMLDTAREHSQLQFCIFKLEPGKYDDLMLQLVDIFSKSARWQKHLDTLNKADLQYDKKIVRDELEYYGFFKPLGSMFLQLGYQIGSIHLRGNYELMPKKELKRLGKDKELVIPMPTLIEVQLHVNKR